MARIIETRGQTLVLEVIIRVMMHMTLQTIRILIATNRSLFMTIYLKVVIPEAQPTCRIHNNLSLRRRRLRCGSSLYQKVRITALSRRDPIMEMATCT